LRGISSTKKKLAPKNSWANGREKNIATTRLLSNRERERPHEIKRPQRKNNKYWSDFFSQDPNQREPREGQPGGRGRKKGKTSKFKIVAREENHD